MTSDQWPVTSDQRKAKSYKDLLVWHKGIALAKRIYATTQKFPAHEKFGLVSQMRRPAVSIPSNIAEGQARHTPKEFVQFVSHAEGSLAELETQLLLALELGHCPRPETGELSEMASELGKMLGALRRKLENSSGRWSVASDE